MDQEKRPLKRTFFVLIIALTTLVATILCLSFLAQFFWQRLPFNIFLPSYDQIQKGIIEKARVARVIDGDTVILDNGEHVRYIGINAPEVEKFGRGAECFGNEARDFNRRLVEGKIIELEKDISNTDKYGRLLRYIYLNGEMVNEILVRSGYASVRAYPPDLKYHSRLISLEKEAREVHKGIWYTCR